MGVHAKIEAAVLEMRERHMGHSLPDIFGNAFPQSLGRGNTYSLRVWFYG